VILRVNHSSGIPLYLQLMEQIKHAVETGALHAGDQLPTIRKLAEDLVMNPNTVARAYRELEHEGIIELKHGSGAYIRESLPGSTRITKKTQAVVQSAIERLVSAGLTEEEIRKMVENELSQLRGQKLQGADHD